MIKTNKFLVDYSINTEIDASGLIDAYVSLFIRLENDECLLDFSTSYADLPQKEVDHIENLLQEIQTRLNAPSLEKPEYETLDDVLSANLHDRSMEN